MTSESDIVLATIRRIIRAIDLHSKSLTKRYGLTGPQLLVLKEFRKGSNLTVGQVAQNISLSQATVTAILDRLEKLTFVQRNRNKTDKRKVNVILSVEAKKILDSDPSLLQDEFVERFNKLQDWEKTLLISSLQRTASMMNAGDIISPPVLASGPLAATELEVQTFFEDKDSSNSQSG